MNKRQVWKLVLVLALPLITAVAGCAGASSPEGSVRTYFRALTGGDSEKMASVFIPEFRDIREAVLPKVSVSNLIIEKISEASDTAEVTAEYDAQIIIDGGPTAHAKVKFTLIKTGGKWLISNAEAEPVSGIAGSATTAVSRVAGAGELM